MSDFEFIQIYKIFDRYDSELEQRFINLRNDLYGRTRDFDEVDYLHMMEIVIQRRLLSELRRDVLSMLIDFFAQRAEDA